MCGYELDCKVWDIKHFSLFKKKMFSRKKIFKSAHESEYVNLIHAIDTHSGGTEKYFARVDDESIRQAIYGEVLTKVLKKFFINYCFKNKNQH